MGSLAAVCIGNPVGDPTHTFTRIIPRAWLDDADLGVAVTIEPLRNLLTLADEELQHMGSPKARRVRIVEMSEAGAEVERQHGVERPEDTLCLIVDAHESGSA